MAITPYLYYEDLGGALKFLSKAFGFRKCGQTSKGPDGKLNHASMKLGEGIIMMGYPGPKYGASGFSVRKDRGLRNESRWLF